MCSTPFGIGDRFTRFGNERYQIGNACSTPFGIGDRFTLHIRKYNELYPCAQRLSASEIGSPSTRQRTRRPSWWCSTPFGIGDRFTLMPCQKYFKNTRAQRLSASEIGSRTDRRESARPTRVLNAFRHRRSVHLRLTKHVPTVASAQRLSASEIGSRSVGNDRAGDCPVLNAFRHRRSVHPSSRNSGSQMILCSTPFGIGDRFTA